MTELLTAAQMRAIEQAAIDSGEVTGLELMERAGQGVVDAVFAEWPQLAPAAGTAWGPAPSPLSLGPMAQQRRPPRYLGPKEEVKRRAVVLCGPGNNGGDGFVVARLLHAVGWDVDVFFYGDAERLPPDARVNYELWCVLGEVLPLHDQFTGFREGEPDIYIDALFGTGLSRPIAGLGKILRHLCDCSDVGAALSLEERRPFYPPVVAVDVPSGFCADSGRSIVAADFDLCGGARACCVAADLTVTFHKPKVGHFLEYCARHSGKISVVDLGLDDRTSLSLNDIVSTDNRTWSVGKYIGHKFLHGHALILSGSMGRGGAARLAARGAIRIGAGVVTVGCPPSALLEHATQLTAVMVRKVPDAAALTDILTDDRLNAICVGPGLGLGPREADLVAAVLSGTRTARKAVLDADALTLISRDPDLMAALTENCVITPHAGEFARLFPDIAERLAAPVTTGPVYSKVDATREAAKRAGCVVLFKGPDTVIAHPDGRCSINAALYDRNAPWLATAGAGDVLAGFITGLLARGLDPMQAAESGAWLHVECALSFGPGLIAEDLPEELPTVFRELDV
ncbi:NAD(P)H-hydrate dehydratase [Rhodobacteraceae bacterium S2214]|nr:NAD(P)H-hydrate dehydratase [Rhodobacteraceae bacterium S2214]